MLNAFGIVGILTNSIAMSGLTISRCSTPFGIIGILTYHPVSPSWSCRRAQRLSASVECSPLGCIPRSVSSHVLNAFRHHRKLRALKTIMVFQLLSRRIDGSTPSRQSQFDLIVGIDPTWLRNLYDRAKWTSRDRHLLQPIVICRELIDRSES